MRFGRADPARRAVTLAVVLATVATACSPAARADELVVFAAASLTDALPELTTEFLTTVESPGTITETVAGSQSLVVQVLDGAPADVVVTADEPQMARLVAAEAVAGAPAVVAHNDLVIAVPRGNPAGIRGLADLARDDLTVVLPAPQVPAGAYVRQILEQTDVTLRPASLELDVRAARMRVVLGEADAALVYATDVTGTAAVDAVDLPHGRHAATYYAAALTEEGEAFVSFLQSDHGRTVLRQAGFSLPEPRP